MAEGARPLPAEEDGVLTEVVENPTGVELREHIRAVAPDVLGLVDGAALRRRKEAPGGDERLVRAAGPAPGLGAGDGDGPGVRAGPGEVGGLHIHL